MNAYMENGSNCIFFPETDVKELEALLKNNVKQTAQDTGDIAFDVLYTFGKLGIFRDGKGELMSDSTLEKVKEMRATNNDIMRTFYYKELGDGICIYSEYFANISVYGLAQKLSKKSKTKSAVSVSSSGGQFRVVLFNNGKKAALITLPFYKKASSENIEEFEKLWHLPENTLKNAQEKYAENSEEYFKVLCDICGEPLFCLGYDELSDFIKI